MNTRARFLLAALALLLVGLAAEHEAQALDKPLSSVQAFQITCATSATLIIPPAGAPTLASFRVWNGSATAVFLGGSDVNTTTLGYPLCNTTSCGDEKITLDARAVAYCRVASGTTVVTVIAGKGG